MIGYPIHQPASQFTECTGPDPILEALLHVLVSAAINASPSKKVESAIEVAEAMKAGINAFYAEEENEEGDK